jgi:hypothetical protein
MSKTVYLIGHGRVSTTVPPAVLSNTITMHWAGPLGDVTAGLSHKFLNGVLTIADSTSPPGSSIPQHYLCSEAADIDSKTDLKIRDFFARNTPDPHGCPDPYVLYPRQQKNLSLSSILDFLLMLSPTSDWQVYWTCCRGYIGQKNPYTTRWDKAQNAVRRELRADPEKTPELTDQGHKTVEASFDTLRMIARSDAQHINPGMMLEYTKAIEGIMRVRV